MKLLVISNLFPPYTLGGYEQRCSDVCDVLSLKGHQITVVTSNYKTNSGNFPFNRKIKVYRALDFQWFINPKNLVELAYIEWQNYNYLRSLVNNIKPELVYVWSCRGLSGSVFSVISNCIKEKDFPVIFDISDNWLLELKNSRWFHYWKDKSEESKLKKIIKTFIENIILKFLPTKIEYNISDSFYFTSDNLKRLYKNNRFKVDDSPVFHPFVPKVFFSRKRRETINYIPFKIIYLGRITAAKGVITIIEAMKILKDQRLLVELSIIGNNDLEPEYYYGILSLINRYRLKNQINFKKQVSRKFVPELITKHHVTICPSIGHEAFMTIPLESMASNVPVIATPVGGNKEYLKHEENVLLFDPGNAKELAKCITRLINEKQLYTKLQNSGINFVSNNYTSDQIITKIERYLIDTKINFNN